MPGIRCPFRRTARPIVGGNYMRGLSGNNSYVGHHAFAKEPENYVRAFLLLQNDLRRLFEYVEPADENSRSYSFRVHEILLRACVEVEANCKAILVENGYMGSGNWTMEHYKKIEASHRLSGFMVKVPSWRGNDNIRTPFASFASSPKVSPEWYKAYNATKHDRHVNFDRANFRNAVDAVCGVLTLLAAQFVTHDFDPTSSPFGRGDEGSNFWPAQGSFFTVRYPDDWPQDEHYDLANWEHAKTQPTPVQQYPYP
jgi:hypothetical protein